MIILSLAIFVQLLVWAVIHLVLYVMIQEGIYAKAVLPVYIIWFWSNFYLCGLLNGKLASKTMKRGVNEDGTLDPYIRKARMYIEGILVRSHSHGR